MTKEQVRARIQEIGIIPAVRVDSAEDALFATEAVCASGIPIVEVTMTVPGAIEVIRELVTAESGTHRGSGDGILPGDSTPLRGCRSCVSNFTGTGT